MNNYRTETFENLEPISYAYLTLYEKVNPIAALFVRVRPTLTLVFYKTL